MRYVLEDVFQIIMRSCTHNHKLVKSFLVFYKSYIQFILPKNIGVMCNETLYHRGSKSRPDSQGILTMEDMTLFTYLWQFH